MAKSTSGKWVSRVGSAGGGKTYSKTRPSSFYAIVVLIVVLGLALVVYSRYEYQNPVKKAVIEPAIGTTEFAGLSIQDCGATLPYLTADATTFKGGFKVGADDVIQVSPTTPAEAGNNATVKNFASEYPRLLVTRSELAVPTSTGAANPATTFKNGDVCGTKTKYSGKKGKVVYAYWTSFAQKTPKLVTNPAKIKFVKDLRVTLAFEPTGVTPTQPTTKTVDEMVLQATTSSTTTTTSAPTTTTTAGPATTTTTTAGPATTTTTTSGTTTTTKG